MTWFVETDNKTERQIYYFDYFTNQGYASEGYIGRTDFSVEDPTNKENITLKIENADVAFDDGTYYCTTYPIAGFETDSNRIDIQIQGKYVPKTFPHS